MSLAAWEGSEVWEGFGFAKEHLAPVGAEVLCWGAAAPGFYFQLSSGSMRERVAAHRWLSCAGVVVLALGLAAPWVLGGGEVDCPLLPPCQQQWVCRESSLVVMALLCHGSLGRWTPWQTGPH